MANCDGGDRQPGHAVPAAARRPPDRRQGRRRAAVRAEGAADGAGRSEEPGHGARGHVRRDQLPVRHGDAGEGAGRASLAGKTGTAEFFRDWNKDGKPDRDDKDNLPTHAWFTSFAPYVDPEIVVTVFVANGGEGSAVAAPDRERSAARLLCGQEAAGRRRRRQRREGAPAQAPAEQQPTAPAAGSADRRTAQPPVAANGNARTTHVRAAVTRRFDWTLLGAVRCCSPGSASSWSRARCRATRSTRTTRGGRRSSSASGSC